MIDATLLNHPEQLAVRLSQMEKDIQSIKLRLDRLERSK